MTSNHLEREKVNGAITQDGVVSEEPWTLGFCAAHYPNYNTVTEKTTVFVHLDKTKPYTGASAYYDNVPTSGGILYGSAHAKSAAATMGVIQNSIEITPWPF
ncbi:MAG: hypothetical protein JWN98_1867 [Abditibacteriota bacterium]|nr:hypothetical protein [Abditibacteriota bacterium]